jgi:hypothetical protein
MHNIVFASKRDIMGLRIKKCLEGLHGVKSFLGKKRGSWNEKKNLCFHTTHYDANGHYWHYNGVFCSTSLRIRKNRNELPKCYMQEFISW